MYEFMPGNPVWSYRMLVLLSTKIPFGAADFFECWRTIARMPSGDLDAWYLEWVRTAQTVEQAAEEASRRGRWKTAVAHWTRAFVYYRQAEFFLAIDDDRKAPAYQKARECFQRTIPWLTPKPEIVGIPFEDYALPGYFIPADSPGNGRAPTVVFFTGLDTMPEENYLRGGRGLAERGVSVLLLNGPGVGSTLRLHRIPSRPDYERVAAAALDYLETRPDVDPERLGVWGVSMGGYYAPRAAAFDLRIRACVVWGACYDILHDLYEYYPPSRPQLQGVVGARDLEETREKLRAFTLEGVASRIRCPLLVCHGEDDILVPVKSAHRTYDEARGPKTLRIWTKEEGGATHCMLDNLTMALPFMQDWVVDALRGDAP